MNTNIQQIIDKYWNAETSVEEEAILRSYLKSGNVASDHQSLIPLFAHFEDQQQIISDSDPFAMLHMVEKVDEILEKYFEAETTLEEEKFLKSYFSDENVADEHIAYLGLFGYLNEQASITSDIDISAVLAESSDMDSLLEKYWNAETTMDEETQLKAYFASSDVEERHQEVKHLFDYYAEMAAAKSTLDIEEVLRIPAIGQHRSDDVEEGTKSATVINIRKLITGVAAVFVLGFAAFSIMNNGTQKEISYKGKFVQLDEEAEAREAYEITKQALAFLSKNLNESGNTVKRSVSKAEKVNILK